jgi:hypothetical protein
MTSNGTGSWVDFRYVMTKRINASRNTDAAENLVVKMYWQCHPPCSRDNMPLNMDTLTNYHREALKYNHRSFNYDYRVWGRANREFFKL